LFGLLLLTILGLGHEVALGAVAQWGSHNYDALLVLPPTYPPRQKLAAFMVDKQDSLPFQVGRVVGSTATVLQGITEIVDGGRRIQVGVLVSAENVVFGGAVVVSGVAEGVHGAVVVSQGVRGLVESGWEQYDIHHIIPREYGGTNVFDNLVPVLREIHQQELNTWWRGY